jgi:predicted ribosomally synthesized peptide with SipW-like signal peptide
MNRFKVLFLSLVSLVLVVAVIGGATLALFTASGSNGSNQFAAGTLAISNADLTTWDVNVGNMAPGDSYEKSIRVTNTGSLALEFAGTNTRTGALFGGSTPAVIDLVDAFGSLAPGASKDVTVRVSLPLGAGNSYQMATGSVVVTFHAWQSANLTTGAATAVQTNNNAYNAPRNAYYDGYLFQDSGSNTIPLIEANLLAMYEIRPGSTANYLSAEGSSDPKFWFNNAKPSGTYHYVLVTTSGNRYTATINHISD